MCWQSLCILSFLQPPATVLDIPYHATLGLLCLAAFTHHDGFKIHPCCSVSQYFILFCGRIIFHCVEGHITFCLHIHQWMDIWLFPVQGYYEQRCYECWSFCVDICFVYIAGSMTAGSYGKSMSNILINCHALFQNGCTILYSNFLSPLCSMWALRGLGGAPSHRRGAGLCWAKCKALLLLPTPYSLAFSGHLGRLWFFTWWGDPTFIPEGAGPRPVLPGSGL